MAQPAYEVDATWSNHIGNEKVDPLRIYSPQSIDEVVAIVQAAERDGVTTRAVGSGHSWSDVALTEGYLMKTDGLSAAPASEPDFLTPAWQRRTVVRAEAGIRLRELNAYLDDRGLGLAQMGGYDQQTVAGVTSTSTHGSGTSFGPLNDYAHSLDMVVSGGRVVRVERAQGPTDRAAFGAHHGDRRELIQDDDVFDAVSVGMGCMGIVCTALLEVVPEFYMREVRELHPWKDVKRDLEDGSVLADNEHYELVFSPYKHRGDQRCLVTTRNRIPDSELKDVLPENRKRSELVEQAARDKATPKALRKVLCVVPGLAPLLLQLAMRSLKRDEYVAISYKVFNIGDANLVPAWSGEVGIAMDGRHIQAVERVFAVADDMRRRRKIYQTSPIALRFVKASPAYASMMYGADTMMMELIELHGSKGAVELIHAYELALDELGGRQHWGQINMLSGDGRIAELYPRYGDWQRVHRQMNATGVFDSPFSERVGIAADRRA